MQTLPGSIKRLGLRNLLLRLLLRGVDACGAPINYMSLNLQMRLQGVTPPLPRRLSRWLPEDKKRPTGQIDQWQRVVINRDVTARI